MVDLATGLGMGVEQLIEAGENMLFPFFSVLLGGTSEMLFERVLFLAIIFAIVYIVISKMPVFDDNQPVIWIVSVSVSLLSTRFLVGENLLQTMLLPYSVFGIAVSSALPLLIYFTFVQKFDDSATVRKMLWVFYIIVFIGIWGTRYDDVGGLAWIYLLSAGASLVFLLFDGTIRRAIVKQEMTQLGIGSREDFMRKLRKQMGELENDKRDGYVTDSEYKRLGKKIRKQMKAVYKN